MADFSVGEKIFNEILEYPLPKKAGTRDYVFYMVPASDPFGAHGRKFFNAYFPNHKSFNLKSQDDAKSLEDIISILFNEVTHGGVTQIREIIIQAHGNLQRLIFPSLEAPSLALRTTISFWMICSCACCNTTSWTANLQTLIINAKR